MPDTRTPCRRRQTLCRIDEARRLVERLLHLRLDNEQSEGFLALLERQS